MGLDCTSYAKITALPEDYEPPRTPGAYGTLEVDWDALYDGGITRACTYASFPRAMDGLPGGHEPDPEAPNFLGSRWYQLEDPGPTTHSSYGGHSMFRRMLIETFWPRKAYAAWEAAESPNYAPEYIEGAPFIDLLCFADNEGILGPEACARLAADFVKADPSEIEADWDRRQFLSWKDAVLHAAHGGAIVFH